MYGSDCTATQPQVRYSSRLPRSPHDRRSLAPAEADVVFDLPTMLVMYPRVLFFTGALANGQPGRLFLQQCVESQRVNCQRLCTARDRCGNVIMLLPILPCMCVQGQQ